LGWGIWCTRERKETCKHFWMENLMEESHLEDMAWILEIGWVGYGLIHLAQLFENGCAPWNEF